MASITAFTAARSLVIEQKAETALANSKEICWTIALSDEKTALSSENRIAAIRAPFPMTITSIKGSLNNQSNAGNVTVGMKKNNASILSTVLTIEEGEKTSVTALTQPVISDDEVEDDDEISFDLLTHGIGAAGLKVTIYGVRVYE